MVGLIRGLEVRMPRALIQRSEDRMHAVIDEWTGDRFSASNAVTDQWVEDDLAALGYAL